MISCGLREHVKTLNVDMNCRIKYVFYLQVVQHVNLIHFHFKVFNVFMRAQVIITLKEGYGSAFSNLVFMNR